MHNSLDLEFLPPYSPELQPAYWLWPLTNEPLVNKSFETIEELEEVILDRLNILMKEPEFISGLTCFHWWPKTNICNNWLAELHITTITVAFFLESFMRCFKNKGVFIDRSVCLDEVWVLF